MSEDSNNIESDLRELRAVGLDPSLLDRLEACADETWTRLSPIEMQLEQQLRRNQPSKLPEHLLNSLEAITRNIPAPSPATVIHFPLPAAAKRPANYRWSAVAAVALMGVFSALLIPTAKKSQVVNHDPVEHHSQVLPSPHTSENLIPAGFSSNLSEASDQGVVWPSSNQPHRVVKVVYKDKATLKRSDGTTYEVEQPRVEYYLVPTKSN